MALLCQAGTFTKDDSGVDDTAQDVALPFDPKALIIWGEHLATSDTDTSQDHFFSIGFVDDADTNYCINSISEDGVARSDCDTHARSTVAINFISNGAFVQAKAAVTLGTGKFTATWGINDTVASKIHYIAYGGDDITGTQLGTIDAPIVAGNQSYVLDADVQNIRSGRGVVFFLTGSLLDWEGLYIDSSVGLGVTNGSAQGGIYATELNNADPTTPRDQWREDACVIAHDVADGSVRAKAVFNGFDSSGFDLDWITTIGSVQKVAYLIIKGGRWQVGTGTAKTTAGLKTEATYWKPKGLFTLGMARTAEGISAENVSFQLGAMDGTNEASGGFTEQSGVGTTNIGTMSSITKTLRVMDASDQSVLVEADLDSFNDNDFTLDYTTVDGSAYKYTWVACNDYIIPGNIEWTVQQVITDASVIEEIAKVTSKICICTTASLNDEIWRSVDRGESWNLVKDLGTADPSSTSIHCIEAMTNNGDNSICLAGTGAASGIWRSIDAGLTWTHVYTAVDRIYRIERITDSIALAIEDDLLLRSTDAGANWVPAKDFFLEDPSQNRLNAIGRVTDSIVLVSTYPDCQIWRSTNAGADWTLVKSLADEVPPQTRIFTFAALTSTIVLCGTQPNGQIWRSDDAGLTWALMQDLSLESGTISVRTIVRVSDTEAFAGGLADAEIWRSTDAGLTWILQDSLYAHPEQNTTVWHLERLNTQSILAGSSGTVWKSLNSDVTTTTTTTVPLNFIAPASQGSGVQPGVVSEGFGSFGFGWG